MTLLDKIFSSTESFSFLSSSHFDDMVKVEFRAVLSYFSFKLIGHQVINLNYEVNEGANKMIKIVGTTMA